MSYRLASFLAAILMIGFVVAACGAASSRASTAQDPWSYDSVSKVYTMCTQYGDRLYALNSGVAVVPGGCRDAGK